MWVHVRSQMTCWSSGDSQHSKNLASASQVIHHERRRDGHEQDDQVMRQCRVAYNNDRGGHERKEENAQEALMRLVFLSLNKELTCSHVILRQRFCHS
jgi:hypothetical protein